MADLSAIIFDLDDTLIDRSRERPPWPEFATPHHRKVYDALSQKYGMPTWPTYYRMLTEVRDAMWAEPVIAPRLVTLIRATLSALGVRADGTEDLQILRSYDWGPVAGVVPFGDTRDTLTGLSLRGLRLGLLTNSSEPMWMRDIELHSYGLIDFFPECRVASSDVGFLKPDPRPFRAALSELGVDPSAALYVGDRMESDILGAHAVGMRTALLSGPNSDGVSGHADLRLATLSELLDAFDYAS